MPKAISTINSKKKLIEIGWKIKKDMVFINYWKLSLNPIIAIKIMYTNTFLHAKIWSKQGASHLCFYGDVINKAKILKSDTSKLVKSLKNHISKGCCLREIVLAKI